MNSEKTLLITGATGFVGSYAVRVLRQKYEQVKCLSLRKRPASASEVGGVDVVLHLAGKAHQMTAVNPQEYFEVNYQKTLNFAKTAKEEGVKHFIFVSTVKVYGEAGGQMYDEYSECHPVDPYGESKLMAEQGLLKLTNDQFRVSIIRPPLVYGPGVKGNLEKLEGLIRKLPVLPFGGIENERSMVFVGNLTALIIAIIDQGKEGVFIAGDQSRKSTSDLVEMMIRHMNLNKPNFRIPTIVRSMIAQLRPALYSRLFESYIIDNSQTNERLNFIPPFSFSEGIASMVSAGRTK